MSSAIVSIWRGLPASSSATESVSALDDSTANASSERCPVKRASEPCPRGLVAVQRTGGAERTVRFCAEVLDPFCEFDRAVAPRQARRSRPTPHGSSNARGALAARLRPPHRAPALALGHGQWSVGRADSRPPTRPRASTVTRRRESAEAPPVTRRANSSASSVRPASSRASEASRHKPRVGGVDHSRRRNDAVARRARCPSPRRPPLGAETAGLHMFTSSEQVARTFAVRHVLQCELAVNVERARNRAAVVPPPRRRTRDAADKCLSHRREAVGSRVRPQPGHRGGAYDCPDSANLAKERRAAGDARRTRASIFSTPI